MRGIQIPPWKDYVEGMENTFDARMDKAFADFDAAVRAESQPSQIGTMITGLFGKFTMGVSIGLGIAVGMAIARAGVGL